MKKFIPIFLVLFFIVPFIAMAQVDPANVVCNILGRIKVIVAALGFGLAVILLIVGGIKYMVSGGDEEKAKASKKLIINAIIGIVIILASVFILALVQGFLSGAGVSILQNNCPMGL